ncbi:hypothetical protein KR018_010321 [Drosophila ironensis]|nr:hypothetical protein KR018_010321 [Drosophila ironensis]
MLSQEIAPTEIGKHANIIRAAQEELANMDVLVCGRCLRAYNFVEEFQSHKEDACEKENANSKESLDTKPTIWAFTLWKATQLHTRKDAVNAGNSWALYQHWVKLEDSVREPWIVAGKTIQSFGKIAHGQLQDMPVRITKTVVNPNNSNNGSSVSPSIKSPVGKLPTLANQLKDTENERPKSKSGTPTPSAASVLPVGGAVKSNNRIAIRIDSKTEQRTEEAVEKIVAKRFNPRRKTHEYLVKWVDRSHHENTWEVMANLERVPFFLQMFEKQLARQKLTREKGIDALKRLQTPVSTTKTETAPPLSPVQSQVSPTSRPSRTSKTKAMDSFKQWVNEAGGVDGSSSPSSANEDESATEQEWASSTGPVKRKLDRTDSSMDDLGQNDSLDLEDLEEDLPTHTVKRLRNGGSSVQLNKPRVQILDKVQTKVNGNSNTSASESKMGEIIYTEDSTSSGMFRKPEMPNTISLKKEKTECPIRYLSRSEVATNLRGVFRVGNSEAPASVPPSAIQALSQKNSSTHAGVGAGAVKRLPLARSAHSGANSPITVGQRQQVLRTPTNATSLQRRPVVGANAQVRLGQQQALARNQSGSRVLARTGTGTPQQRAAATTLQAGAKTVTPEQKILQLSKSGDLKVTRKVVTRDELIAQRAAQARQRQTQALQHQPSSQVQRVMAGRQRTAPKPSNTPAPVHVPMEQEEEVPQHQAQLCPITGKLIGQEETQLQMEQEQQQEQQREQLEAAAQALLSGEQQVLTNEDGSALLVRGEDGTVYQVAGKNAEGQTILVTQGPDGEQQFAYVAAAEGEDQDVLSLDHAVAEAVQAGGNEEAQGSVGEGEQILVSMTEEELAQHQAAVLQQTEGNASIPTTAQIHITTSDSDGTEAQIPAEIVQADLPSPGGTRRVVLLLQDGSFMMTEMHEDQFKTLNIPT